jgi:hypothetical protein
MAERSAPLWNLLAAVLNELDKAGENPTILQAPDIGHVLGSNCDRDHENDEQFWVEYDHESLTWEAVYRDGSTAQLVREMRS